MIKTFIIIIAALVALKFLFGFSIFPWLPMIKDLAIEWSIKIWNYIH